MKKQIIIAVFCLLLIILCFAGVYFFIQSEVKKPFSQDDKDVVFEVREGEGIKEIAKNLKDSSLIKNDFYFLIWILKEGKAKKILVANYCLSPKMNVVEIIEKFTKEGGGIPSIVKLTFPEGWRISQMEERLQNKGLIDFGDILKFKIKEFKKETAFLNDAPEEASFEGYLFPDTYFFYCPSPQIVCKEGRGEILKCKKGDPRAIIEKFLANFNEKLTSDLRSEIKKQNKSIFEIITMASLIEKEVRDFDDKRLVSGILWKRREHNIPLQVDATIAFLTGQKTTKISLEDLQIDSPYNTYKYQGLPLGPICNPGFQSILAALYPKESDYWYYLSTTEGDTIFSKTLEEHNLAKTKYFK